MKSVFPDAINTLGVCYTKKEEYLKIGQKVGKKILELAGVKFKK